MLKTIILTAPQGWGKTCNAEALRQEFGCTSVEDGWNPHSSPIIVGALHLTNAPPAEILECGRIIAKVVSRGWD